MKNYSHYRIVALLLATSFSGYAAHAQLAPVAATPGTLQQFLSGDLVPLNLKFSQMQSGWSRVVIERKGEIKAAAAPAFIPPDPIAQGFRRYFGQGSDAVWTQGRTVSLNGGEQLVVYRAAFPNDKEIGIWFESRFTTEMKAVENDNVKFMNLAIPLTREFLDTVPVRASLINTSDITSLRDIEKFGYDFTFAAFEHDIREQKSVSDRERAQSRSESSRVTMQILTLALNQYVQDYDETLPPLASWDAANKALQPYIKSEIKLGEPGQKIHTNPLLSAKKLAHLQPYASSLIVFYSDADQNGNRWVVFLDDNIEEIDSARWSQIKKASRLP